MRGRRRLRPPSSGSGPVFIAWGAVGGRSAEIAAALDGESYCLSPPSEARRLPAPVRWLIGAVLTMWYLARRRPRSIVVTNPPIFPAAICWVYTVLRRERVAFVLDSHPGSFGRQGDRVGALMLPVHAFLARRADLSLVTTSEWVTQVEAWGGRAVVFHEAPGRWDVTAPRPLGARPRVLFVSRIGRDEPVDQVLLAAASLPDVDVQVTGRLSDITEDLMRLAGPNVEFVGFQPFDVYAEMVAEADVVLSLTTEPTSVMRAAYEAVYAGKVVVVSDWPIDRELFPDAVFVGNDAESIAAGIVDACQRHAQLRELVLEMRRVQMERWNVQLEALVQIVTPAPVLPD